MALISADVNQKHGLRARRNGSIQESLDGIHIKPDWFPFSSTRHVRVEQCLMVFVLSKPFELAFAHSPLHGGFRVFLGIFVIVHTEVFGEFGDSWESHVVSGGESVSVCKVRALEATYMHGMPSRPIGWVMVIVLSVAL
jgi:hypothetical protein